MKAVKILFILLIMPLLLPAKEYLVGSVKDNNHEPLVGVNIHWQDDINGVVSDANGCFKIEGIPGEQHMLVFSYVGFKEKIVHIDDFKQAAVVVLDEDNELDEIIVERSVPGTIKSRTSLLNTEKVTAKELTRAACCNLSESFETNPSVDVSFSDAVTGAKQIQLLGLSGTYVQMLTENYPNFRGSATLYGLDFIPGPWMESIQVSKGAASIKNGYESLTGQMNVEYKKPMTADPLSLNIFASDAGRYEGNADAAFKLDEKLSTGIFMHYSNENYDHDGNKDEFLDAPKKNQLNMMNRWHYQSGKYISQYGIKFLRDYRTSGQTYDVFKNKSLAPYKIHVNTNRAEFFTKNAYILDSETAENIALIFTGAYHDQKSEYDIRCYNVYETNMYASLMYEKLFAKHHHLSTGLSMNWDKYAFAGNLRIENLPGQPTHETTTGGYVQYTCNKDDKFVVLAGLRGDYSTLYGFFVTPRLHLKFMPAKWFNLRASAGMGYRSVFIMPENSYFLASSRKIQISSNLNQEKAWNYGVNANFYIPLGNRELELSAEWYQTRFIDQVVADVDSDSHAVSFYNLVGRSYANSVQFQASYMPLRGLTILGAYRWMEAKTNYDGIMRTKPLTSRFKGLLTTSYETPLRKWQFDLTTQFNGSGRNPVPDASNPLWDNQFRYYTVLNAQITKNFRTWSIYAGSENITDFKQKSPIISAEDPYSKDFDATMVWGPTMGRKFYVGLRYIIGK